MEQLEGPRIGLVVFAHGSSVPEANEAVRRVAADTARHCGVELWSEAFLDPVRPDLAAAVERLTSEGATRIVVTPYFLTMGMHLQKDLPRILNAVSESHPGIEILRALPLDGDPSLVDILAKRAREALDA